MMNAEGPGLPRQRRSSSRRSRTCKALKKRYETVGVENKGKVFNTDLLFHIELGFMLDCAEMICVGAIERKESRGAHFRIDYPQRDDAELAASTSPARTAPTARSSREAPVTITRWAAAGKEVLMEVKLKVKRFDPESRRRAAATSDYTVDMPENATVLDTLIEVREYHDGTLSLRCSCRSAICGSCAMRINGRARLACKTQVEQHRRAKAKRSWSSRRGNMPVIKDLVVDMAPFWDKVRAVKPWLQPAGPPPEREYLVPNEAMSGAGRGDELHHVRRLRLRLHGARGRQELPRPGGAGQGLPLRRRPARRRRPRRGCASSASRAASGTARAATCASRSAPRTSSRWTRS